MSVAFIAVEFLGKGEFADDRPLGKDGGFLTGSYALSDVAEFETEKAARDAAAIAPNKRAAGLISSWSRAS